jgi:hypothetical protein
MADSVTQWLMDSDPALRWQVLRDVTSATAANIAAERARVATTGFGASLLAAQQSDGTWGGVAWNRSWDSTMHVLMLLRECGADPDDPTVRAALDRVRAHVTWAACGPPECSEHRFFDGETEPCINAQVAAVGAYFRVDVRPLIDRLLSEQLADGGWNCEAERGSTRSSFNTTICVLEALLEYEHSIRPDAAVLGARVRGEAYLLDRQLCRRRSTGERIVGDRKKGAVWSEFAFPTWWHYDVLRGLDYLRSAQVTPDSRVHEPVALVQSKCQADGRWLADVAYAGTMPLRIDDGAGLPSRWITLRAMRVLQWATSA